MSSASVSSSSPTPNPNPNNNTILKSFINTLYKFIHSLSDTFHECNKLKEKVEMFENVVLNNEFMQKLTIQKWHEAFVPLYQFADKRDMKSIIDSKFWLLEEIDFSQKWADPGLSEEDKKNIWMYIDFLNGNARVYHSVPKNLQSSLEKAAEEIGGDINPNTFNNIDVSEMLKMTQKLVSNLSEDDIKDLSKNMGSMIEGLGGFDGIMNFGQKSGLFGSLFGAEGNTILSSAMQSANQFLKEGNGTGTGTESGGASASFGGASEKKESAEPTSSEPKSSEPTSASMPAIPGLTPELEEMFASIGSKMLAGGNNPLEAILQGMKM